MPDFKLPDTVVHGLVNAINGKDDPHTAVPVYMERVIVSAVNATSPPSVDVSLNGTTIHNVKYVGLPVVGNEASAVISGIEASSDMIVLCWDLGPGSIGSTFVGSISYPHILSGAPPTASPTPRLKNGVGFIYVQYDAAPGTTDIVTYECHVSTTNGFTPTSGTKVSEGTLLFQMIRTLPGSSTLLTLDTTYYVKLIAKSNSGSAAPGAQASIAFKNVTGPDIEAGSVSAGDAIFATAAILSADINSLAANKLTAGTITANIEIIGPTIRTAAAGVAPRIEMVHGVSDSIYFFSGDVSETAPGFISANVSSGAFLKISSPEISSANSSIILTSAAVSLVPDGATTLVASSASIDFFNITHLHGHTMFTDNGSIDLGSGVLQGSAGSGFGARIRSDTNNVLRFSWDGANLHVIVDDAVDLGGITFH